ncbi:hypothetical protein HD595_002740 [Nonomuraea roseoviolacea subsp. carminata]|uniref:Uncharacterized protein n=1 Tax=Nonomuraea roseoviolacea subsp. carminata TaxID=160689 RepID=A0ABT1JXY9_9ACTN|nr:hypothetical protein [Nonomuraea roseoviolacea subsp. carminata]
MSSRRSAVTVVCKDLALKYALSYWLKAEYRCAKA